MTNLVSTDWLQSNLNSKNLVILDASWHLPSAKRNARAEYDAQHIPNSIFFDLDLHSDGTSSLPHMLPTLEKFAVDMKALGINNQSHVVCYDAAGLFSAARCWWMFKIFGHENVFVLDGGLPKWLSESRVVTAEKSVPQSSTAFSVRFDLTRVKSLADVASTTAQIIDARSPTRFRGEEPEPRPGVRPGHIPRSANLHYAKLLNADGTLKNKSELAALFNEVHVDIQKPIITSCGSGVTAAILSLALTELGAAEHALYDGSWADWGSSAQDIELG